MKDLFCINLEPPFHRLYGLSNYFCSFTVFCFVPWQTFARLIRLVPFPGIAQVAAILPHLWRPGGGVCDNIHGRHLTAPGPTMSKLRRPQGACAKAGQHLSRSSSPGQKGSERYFCVILDIPLFTYCIVSPITSATSLCFVPSQ